MKLNSSDRDYCVDDLVNRNPLDADNTFDTLVVLTGHDVLNSHDGYDVHNALSAHAAPDFFTDSDVPSGCDVLSGLDILDILGRRGGGGRRPQSGTQFDWQYRQQHGLYRLRREHEL